MQPLTRQDSRRSVFSWWSDSNPHLQGPTINLHAATKPLLKLMYHRQACDYIRKNRDSPLSRETLEIYAAYLPWDYISVLTKVKIMSELSNRAESEIDARMVVDSPVFHSLAEMLNSPDAAAHSSSCTLLGILASYESTAPAVLALKLCPRLVSFVRGKYIDVVLGAVHALSQIARWPDGAQDIVDARAPEDVVELLQSSSRRIRRRACELVARLAAHPSTAPAIVELNLPVWVMSLIREPDVASYWLPKLKLDTKYWEWNI